MVWSLKMGWSGSLCFLVRCLKWFIYLASGNSGSYGTRFVQKTIRKSEKLSFDADYISWILIYTLSRINKLSIITYPLNVVR